MQKGIFANQMAQRALFHKTYFSDVRALSFTIVPEIICPNMVRLGNIGDGGKWVCNPWRARNGCIIYSLGVFNDISFERNLMDIVQKKTCKLYGFDPNQLSSDVYSKNFPNHTAEFRQYAITSVSNATANQFTLFDVLSQFNHTIIDFLKIDIETNEYNVIPTIFSASVKSRLKAICQMFIEVHPLGDKATELWLKLLKTIRNEGFFMFSKEVNPEISPPAFEYSWLHKNCFRQFNLAEKDLIASNF